MQGLRQALRRRKVATRMYELQWDTNGSLISVHEDRERYKFNPDSVEIPHQASTRYTREFRKPGAVQILQSVDIELDCVCIRVSDKQFNQMREPQLKSRWAPVTNIVIHTDLFGEVNHAAVT